MKKKCRAKIMAEVLGSLLVGMTIFTVTLAHTPALAELSNYSPQGLKAITLEEVLALPDEEIDLATAILILYEEWDASFDKKESLEEINRMALEVRVLINTEDDPKRVISLINHYLFENKGYDCVDDFSSFGLAAVEQKALPQVMKNRKGDCVGLSLLYLALTERLGLPFYGVVLPEHFFVRYDDGQERINIETTRKGKEWDDREYEEEYGYPTYRKNDFYLTNRTKKEVIGVFLCVLGIAYYNKGMYDEAIVAYKKAIEINPNSPESYNNLGIAYDNKGMYDEAIVEYKKAIEISPNHSEAYTGLGVVYAHKGMLDEAIVEFMKAIKLNPDDDSAHYNLGMAYDYKGMRDEAIVEYKKAIEINPNIPEVYANLGIVYGEKGMYDEAIVEFIKAIKLNPDDAFAHNNLAVAYYFRGEYTLAIKHYDKAIGLGSIVHPDILEFLEPYREK